MVFNLPIVLIEKKFWTQNIFEKSFFNRKILKQKNSTFFFHFCFVVIFFFTLILNFELWSVCEKEVRGSISKLFAQEIKSKSMMILSLWRKNDRRNVSRTFRELSWHRLWKWWRLSLDRKFAFEKKGITFLFVNLIRKVFLFIRTWKIRIEEVFSKIFIQKILV